MELTFSQMEAFVDATEAILQQPTSTYSGRGMFGRTCIGMTVDTVPGRMLQFAQQLTLRPDGDGEELLALLARGVMVDSMGLDFIVYWPGIEAPKNWIGEEDDE